MKNFLAKAAIITIALFFWLVAVGAFIDLTIGIWVGFLLSGISIGFWYFFFHLFFEHRANKGK